MKWIATILSDNDILPHAMRQACAEARKWLGATSPNPAVGAVALDSGGHILAVSAHHHAGEAHAEAALLANNPHIVPQIATLCVTLEPCNHQGRTPPCTDAILRSGIKKVVIGTRDPNPQVKGGGIEKLQAAGVEVVTGVAEDECRQLIHAFAYSTKTGKPFVTIKRALDSAGSMIPPPGQKTFTSPDSLRFAHRLRKKADAILTGSGTIVADHPLFTVRHVPDYKDKWRWLAIIDRRGRVSRDYIEAAKQRHLNAIIYRDISEAFTDLTARGTQDVLVEAGPSLTQSVLDSPLWTMSVTIRQDQTDRIDTEFRAGEPLPFDPRHFRWDTMLPQE